jgi:hypothetical protein
MIILSLVTPAAIAVALFVLMAGAWIAQQRTSESGRLGILRKLFILLQNQGFDSIPLLPQKGLVI